MALILCIETATRLCSVALAQNGNLLTMRETFEEKSHATRLTVFIEEIMKEQNLRFPDLDAVALGKGPGSYTGLRIGVSTAKGMCYGADLPLLALSTLHILFHYARKSLLPGVISKNRQEILFCPMIDARRMEVFTCMYTMEGKLVEPVTAKIITGETFTEVLGSHPVFFFGSGMDKCRSVLDHPNAAFLEDIHPHASALAFLAEEAFTRQQFENLAYFEPFYLKDFIATVPKKGIIG